MNKDAVDRWLAGHPHRMVNIFEDLDRNMLKITVLDEHEHVFTKELKDEDIADSVVNPVELEVAKLIEKIANYTGSPGETPPFRS